MEPETTVSPLTPIPTHRRPFHFSDAFTLWASLGVGLLVLQAGALLVPGLGFGIAMATILIGSAIGVVLLALVGVVGSDTGVATMAALRPSLGIRGSLLPTIANIVQLVGWGTFEIIVMRDSAHAIAQQLGTFSHPVLWTLIWGTLATLLAFGGPLLVVRTFLKRWGIWLVYAATIWLTIQLITRYDLTTIVNHRGTGELTFGIGIDLVIAMPLSWLPLIADYTRFGRSARQMFWGTALGYFLANVWFYALGAAYALVLESGDFIRSILLTSGGLFALVVILIDETDNAFADIYSAAVSTGNIVPQLATAWLAIGYGMVCTVLALLVPIGQYEAFLLLIGSLFAPLFGVVLVDHFIIRKRAIEPTALDQQNGMYRYLSGWNWTGLLAWVIGVGTFQFMTRMLPEVGATLPALFVSGLVYWVIARVRLTQPFPVGKQRG